ncbi:chaperone modulatory protein CbpM [Coxiella endosymbiont of Ornithodoros amblus]|uniref:chaperone modulator CbpM n=1 Tax=Coxiella endosymbiont of Ornithodoros amblus TaxID=1656166 RepID=UPI00244E124C|nr:chaperone modulator CbpM [Coxiella endosymbiont of Ornithodoros amblus]MBW5802985.1 chaperone modulatory protein CbpM [Coxiella endosymbiont of Ornithodoros amblus]
MTKQIIKGIIIERSSPLKIDELSQAVHLRREIIIEMVEHHLIEPEGSSPTSWEFDNVCLKRAKIAASFYRDLEINMPGIAIALDLLDKIEYLEQRLRTLERFENQK